MSRGVKERQPGLSVQLKLTLSYAGFLLLAGTVLLAAVWVFLRATCRSACSCPDLVPHCHAALDPSNFGPAAFGPAAVVVLGFLLAFSSWGVGSSPAGCSPR